MSSKIFHYYIEKIFPFFEKNNYVIENFFFFLVKKQFFMTNFLSINLPKQVLKVFHYTHLIYSFIPLRSVNPYLLHFGNIQERHLWKKNPKFMFWSLMTSYIADYLWRHMNLKLHQLGYLYVTWPKSRDVISVRYHVMKVITPEKPETELASFLEKKIQTRLGTFGFFG